MRTLITILSLYLLYMYAWFIFSAADGEHEKNIENHNSITINYDILAAKVASILLDKMTEDGKFLL